MFLLLLHIHTYNTYRRYLAHGKLSAFALRDRADIVNNHKFGTATGVTYAHTFHIKGIFFIFIVGMRFA